MSRKPYRRKTGYQPQDERRLYLRVEHVEPVDMSAVADLLLMLALSGDDTGGKDASELHGTAQRRPFAPSAIVHQVGGQFGQRGADQTPTGGMADAEIAGQARNDKKGPEPPGPA